jgi:peptidoglycan/LPS O-acetylase OafA/YrhL
MQQRLPQLDGIRGIAILVVIFHNESVKFPLLYLDRVFANGWMGVDLFFVLSGFLITGILLDTKQSDGYFKNFYARRCLRIWPLYYSSIFLMFVIIPFLRPSDGHMIFQRSGPWWSFPFYLQNFFVPNPAGAAGLLGVTWSLAVEEQFYLVWPFIVRLCSDAVLRRIAIAIICISPLLRLLLASHGVILYSNTFSRLDGLMAGSLLATAVRSNDFVPSRFVKTAWIVLCITLPLAFWTEAIQAEWIVFSMSALASASLVYLSLFSSQKWLHAVVKNRFVVYTGTISYGLYLLHKLPFDLGATEHFDKYPLISAPILFAAAYGIAALSWNFLEKPFLNLKRYFVTRPESQSQKFRTAVPTGVNEA